MGDSLYSKIRANERFNIDLNAKYCIKGQGKQLQECRITDISSSGAKIRFPNTESLSNGAIVAMDIPIPNTILRIAAEAEIMWTRERFNTLISGVRFTGMLSDNMIQQLVKMNPEVSLAFQ